MSEEENSKKMATTLLESPRGKYLIGQALDIAIQNMKVKPQGFWPITDIRAMCLLRDELFPIVGISRQAKSAYGAQIARDFEDART